MRNEVFIASWINKIEFGSSGNLKSTHQNLYSYGTHYLLCRRLSQTLFLVNTNYRSVTTSCHTGLTVKILKKLGKTVICSPLENPFSDEHIQQALADGFLATIKKIGAARPHLKKNRWSKSKDFHELLAELDQLEASKFSLLLLAPALQQVNFSQKIDEVRSRLYRLQYGTVKTKEFKDIPREIPEISCTLELG